MFKKVLGVLLVFYQKQQNIEESSVVGYIHSTNVDSGSLLDGPPGIPWRQHSLSNLEALSLMMTLYPFYHLEIGSLRILVPMRSPANKLISQG